MRQTSSTASRTVIAAVVVGAVGWIGVVAIGFQLAAVSARSLGFDLELLHQAGRDLAGGRSPYAAALVGGSAPTATELFYSYPPPVAQAMTLVAGVPSIALLVLWGLAAVGGLLVVADALRRRLAPARPRVVVLAVTAAAAPLTLPFAVGLLFGNFDVFFPLLYGAMLLAVLDPERRVRAIGGVALAVAALKLHPASMGLWFLVRAARDRASGSGLVVASAILAGIAIILASLLLGGLQLWLDYVQVVRAGTSAVVVDARNAGIAAVIAALVGGGDPMARTLHLAVGVVALAVTVWAGWRRRDPLEGFAWATAASLSTLPITWYHYPNALIPVAIAAWLRADQAAIGRVRAAIVGAMVVAAISIALLPLLWVAIGLVILAARWSRSERSPVVTEMPPAPVRAAG
jgi:hypothetical protein